VPQKATVTTGFGGHHWQMKKPGCSQHQTAFTNRMHTFYLRRVVSLLSFVALQSLFFVKHLSLHSKSKAKGDITFPGSKKLYVVMMHRGQH